VLAGFGYTTPENFFNGDDRHGELLWKRGGNPCRNGFLSTQS
jgi:hypothetical protein